VLTPSKTTTALLLLQHGAQAVTPAGDCPEYAEAVVQYMQWLQHELKIRDVTLAAHAACSTTVNSSSSSSGSTSQQQCDAAVKAAVQVQLVRADTRERSERVYTIDTAALARLHAAQGEHGASTLSSFIAPPAGWSAPSDTVKLLQYDGTYLLFYTAILRSMLNFLTLYQCSTPSLHFLAMLYFLSLYQCSILYICTTETLC
jgi:hypothetical protein